MQEFLAKEVQDLADRLMKGMRVKCLYGRVDCQFIKKGSCARQNQCLLAGELKIRLQKEKEEKAGEG